MNPSRLLAVPPPAFRNTCRFASTAPQPFGLIASMVYSPTMPIGVVVWSTTKWPPPRRVTNAGPLSEATNAQIGALSGRTPASSQATPFGVVHVARFNVAAVSSTNEFVA